MSGALHDVALVLALAWAAGINLYAALLVFGLMLMLLMIFRPQGLLGGRR